MLGTLSVSQDGRALELPASRKARALLAYLALAPRATRIDGRDDSLRLGDSLEGLDVDGCPEFTACSA
jgi:hypothetical protein